MDNLTDRLYNTMAEIFQVDKSRINNKTSPEDMEEWDSMKHMLLLMAIEEEFEFRFSDEEMTECTNVEEIINVINKKG